jgi:hypothetical protein
VSLWVAVILSHAVLSGCGSSDSDAVDMPPRGVDVPRPVVEGPVVGGRGSAWVSGTSFPLSEVGYVEREYFISGEARSYAAVTPLDSDGLWQTESSSTAEYKTRIVVFRPEDPADFNGSVIMEWLNVSGGLDAAPDWISAHTELTRQGYVWVGVSAQFVGVEGGGSAIPGLGDLSLKGFDEPRYGSLSHPGDSYSYDMFSQAGQAIRDPDGADPMEGWPVQHLIAVGESQSAFRLVTYLNGVHPSADMFDGYLVHSRGGGGAALSQSPLPAVPAPAVTRIREDIGVPVLTFQTETDLFTLGFLPDRQPDTRWHRLWEVAGSAHADTYTLTVGAGDRGDDPSVHDLLVTSAPIPGIIECDLPINAGPQHIVLKAAINALHRWVRDGDVPPSAPRLEVAGNPPGFVTDEFGNAGGGIRTAAVEVPIARLSGLGQSGSSFCFIFGTTVPFDEETLASLYPDNDTYVAAVSAATNAAVAAGYVLEPDAALIVAWAAQSGIGS